MALWDCITIKIHIDVMPGAKPKHLRPYGMPKIHMDTFKKELDHLVELGVLSPQGMSELAKDKVPSRYQVPVPISARGT